MCAFTKDLTSVSASNTDAEEDHWPWRLWAWLRSISGKPETPNWWHWNYSSARFLLSGSSDFLMPLAEVLMSALGEALTSGSPPTSQTRMNLCVPPSNEAKILLQATSTSKPLRWSFFFFYPDVTFQVSAQPAIIPKKMIAWPPSQSKLTGDTAIR